MCGQDMTAHSDEKKEESITDDKKSLLLCKQSSLPNGSLLPILPDINIISASPCPKHKDGIRPPVLIKQLSEDCPKHSPNLGAGSGLSLGACPKHSSFDESSHHHVTYVNGFGGGHKDELHPPPPPPAIMSSPKGEKGKDYLVYVELARDFDVP